jgi:hypothetical protein
MAGSTRSANTSTRPTSQRADVCPPAAASLPEQEEAEAIVTGDPHRHTVLLRRPWDLVVVAGFTILAGGAEVVTGFSHTFFGITTSDVALFTIAATGIGLSYMVSGVLILTMKKWAATVALILLSIDIVGRILLAVAGLYPTDTAKNTFSLIAGTLIVAFVALYVGWKRKSFA